MNVPTGYVELDMVGFTDRGVYVNNYPYVENDLVHYGGNIWRCLIDDTTGVIPTEGLNWTLWVGEPTNLVERIIAPLENNPADIAYAVGRQIIYNDWLWEVTKPIAVGDSLIDVASDPTNGNIKKAPPVETQLLAVKAEADATDTMIAPIETTPAGSPHAAGTKLIYNNVLYDVTTAIAANDALVVYPASNYNIKPADSISSQIQALTNDKVNVSDIANNLTTAESGKVLDARQGKALNDKISNLGTYTKLGDVLGVGSTTFDTSILEYKFIYISYAYYRYSAPLYGAIIIPSALIQMADIDDANIYFPWCRADNGVNGLIGVRFTNATTFKVAYITGIEAQYRRYINVYGIK